MSPASSAPTAAERVVCDLCEQPTGTFFPALTEKSYKLLPDFAGSGVVVCNVCARSQEALVRALLDDGEDAGVSLRAHMQRIAQRLRKRLGEET